MPGLVQLLAAAAPAEPDADLLARFVATRDGAAFAELVRRHGPAVLGTCRRLVGRSAADDAFQATFLVLAARAGSVRKASSVGSWLVGVAGRVGRRMRASEQRAEDRGQTIDPDRLPAPGSPPDVCLLSSDLCEALADEFTRLPDKLRAAAVACLLDGRTQDQAAAALGWSARTVRRRLDEAKDLLRTRLERRGVTPATAVAALAVAGEATAVPAGLARMATDGATLFLAGGGADLPAAALAHGVLRAMTTIRSTAAAAVCVAVLAGLGVGWANDAAPPTEPDRIPAPAAKAVPAPAAPAAHVHKTANFEVTAPTAAVARALGEEFERQRKAAAVEWLGKELPAWDEPVAVRLLPNRVAGWYTGEVRFRGAAGLQADATVQGGLDTLLGVEAPRTAVRLVLTTRLGRRLPRWVDAAIESGGRTDPEITYARCFNHLHDGRALRLATMFLGGGEKSDWDVYEAQGHAVVKFLLARAGDARAVPPAAAGIRVARLLGAVPDTPRGRLVAFVAAGAEANTAASWDAAAKDVYGFDSADRMEAAWLDWLRRNPPPRGEPAPPPDPQRIPPTELTPPSDEPAAVDPAAQVGTANFVVSGPSAEVAKTIAFAAEKHRRDLAKRWFGAVPPDLPEKVAVRVIVTPGNSGGATTFAFGEADGKRPPGVKTAAMELRGPLDTVLKSVLPHEVMHVVLATHFGRPLPRWADEGIAVLAESDAEQFNHEVRARELLNAGRAIRLSTLFRMTEYPQDHVVTFAQGHSVCRFLLDRGAADPHPPMPGAHKSVQFAGGAHAVRFGRGEKEPALVAFLALGTGANTAESWALAAKEVYGFDSLDALEQAWVESLRAPPRRR